MSAIFQKLINREIDDQQWILDFTGILCQNFKFRLKQFKPCIIFLSKNSLDLIHLMYIIPEACGFASSATFAEWLSQSRKIFNANAANEANSVNLFEKAYICHTNHL